MNDDENEDSREDDVAWLDARYHEMYAIGVKLRLHGGDSIGWYCDAIINGAVYCDAIINGTVYCSEQGESQREAMAKAIATVVAARLAGLKLRGNDGAD